MQAQCRRKTWSQIYSWELLVEWRVHSKKTSVLETRIFQLGEEFEKEVSLCLGVIQELTSTRILD
jgi:hypothetical protein